MNEKDMKIAAITLEIFKLKSEKKALSDCYDDNARFRIIIIDNQIKDLDTLLLAVTQDDNNLMSELFKSLEL